MIFRPNLLLVSRNLLNYALNPKRRKVYVAGIQPTGIPHIGNYLGFIQQFIKLQEEEQTAQKFMFIADLHATSTGFLPPDQMRLNVYSMAATLVACGVDVEKTILFQQSEIAEHTELAWILASFQTITALKRLPQYKDKSQQFKNGAVPMGLMCYPVLQAADILLYKTTHVPVGEDQSQHINIVRHMAQVFNLTFKCQYFPVPVKVLSNAPRVKSLKDPTKKMSKSDPTEWSRIMLTDSYDIIFNKCKRATSDSNPKIYFDPVERLAISNLISLHALFSEQEVDAIVKECSDMNTVQFKKSLSNSIEAKVAPIREKINYLTQDGKDQLKAIIKYGNERAKKIAQNNLNEIKQIVGFH